MIQTKFADAFEFRSELRNVPDIVPQSLPKVSLSSVFSDGHATELRSLARETVQSDRDTIVTIHTEAFQVSPTQAAYAPPSGNAAINDENLGVESTSSDVAVSPGGLLSVTLTEVVRTYTSGSADGSGYNIDIVFRGNNWTIELQQAFVDAAELLSDIISGDVPDAFFRTTVDDIRIVATLTDIDGPGGILGQAGPYAYRTDSFIPVNGIMEFDIADAAAYDAIDFFNDIVLHEMIHVLGFGTMWEPLGLVSNGPNGTLEFNGANAAIAYRAEVGSGTLQIETDGGPGTAGGHWDEDLYVNEIMTGYLNTDINVLSNTTIASLEDLGYETIWEPSRPLGANFSVDWTIFLDHFF